MIKVLVNDRIKFYGTEQSSQFIKEKRWPYRRKVCSLFVSHHSTSIFSVVRHRCIPQNGAVYEQRK